MPSTADTASTRDGIRLLTRHWPAASPRAGVLLVHGLGEHSGRYEHVGELLSEAGLETFAWDHRGFGGSAGERAWVEAWSWFHDDVEDRLAACRAALPGKPVVLFGHSLGGLIALGYTLSDRPRPDLLVLSAPGIDDNLAAWKRALAPIMARVLPHLRIANGISPEMVSRDPARQAADRTDPLMVNSSTVRFGALAFDEQRLVREALGRLAVPTLVVHGLDDPVVPPASSEALADLPGVTRRAYAGIRHELHNEPEGPQILADVVAWIEERLGPPLAPPGEAMRPAL